jgi:hypothetical protein
MPSMGARRVDRSRLSGLNLAPSGGPRVPPRVVLGLTRFDGHRSSGFAPGTMSDDRGAGVGEAGRAGRGELIDLQAWPAAPWPGRRSWNTSPGTWWQSQQDDRGGWEVLPPSAGAAGASGRWSTPSPRRRHGGGAQWSSGSVVHVVRRGRSPLLHWTALSRSSPRPCRGRVPRRRTATLPAPRRARTCDRCGCRCRPRRRGRSTG